MLYNVYQLKYQCTNTRRGHQHRRFVVFHKTQCTSIRTHDKRSPLAIGVKGSQPL